MMSCRTACSCSLQTQPQQAQRHVRTTSSAWQKKEEHDKDEEEDSALLALLRAHDTDAAFALFSANPDLLPCSPTTASRLLAQLSFNSDKSSFSRAALVLQRLRARNALSLLDANALSLAAAAAARSGNTTLAHSLILYMLRQGLFPDRRAYTAAVARLSPDDDNSSEDETCSDDDEDDDSSSEDELIAMLADDDEEEEAAFLFLGMHHDQAHYNKVPMERGPESGLQWVMRNLNHRGQCYEMYRMQPEVFHSLHDLLVESYGLKGSSRCYSIEALAMFLWVCGAKESVRQARNRFGRSLDTVHRNFAKVLKCVLKLAADNIKPVDPEFRTIPRRVQQPRFSPYFNNYISALDGTHIQVVVPNEIAVQYRNRKGVTTQNVLAVCDFEMRFTYVLACWPGSVHDVRVFNDAIRMRGSKFPHPPQGKYYLVDSGYPNRRGYLAPYKGTKYHVREWTFGGMPRGMKETFNHAHSSLRNVVERAFGVLKNKWEILDKVRSFPQAKQSHIIVACMALHNFIRDSAVEDVEFAKADHDDEYVASEAEEDADSDAAVAADAQNCMEDGNMNALRDEIAYALFHRSR